MDGLMRLLGGKARPLEVGTRLVHGSALAALAKAYVAAVNQGEWQHTVQGCCLQLHTAASGSGFLTQQHI